MCIANETFKKKLCSEGFARKYNLDILKEIMPSSSSSSNEFFDMRKYRFCPATPFITPSMTTNVFDELLWSTNGNGIYVQCTKLHESSMTFLLLNLLLTPFSCI